MKTIISHFYNEEYLLPFWLNHHKKYFDHGIMIDYGSTDNSVEIIKEICPDWEIHPTRNAYFYAPWVETEVLEYEAKIDGWRVVLNTTEFLFGNFDVLVDTNIHTQHLISSHIMCDTAEQEFKPIVDNLFKERQFGLNRHKHFEIRSARSMHNFLLDYPSITGPGRHFGTQWTNNSCGLSAQKCINELSKDFFILWYGYSPFTEELIERKLQIQTKHHPNGQWSGGHNIDRDTLIRNFRQYRSLGEDLSEIINKYI